MKRLLFSFLFTLLVSASAQAQVATTIARAIRGGPTLPATCSPATSGNKADVFVKTGGSAGVYYCSAANTWTALAGGGGGGSPGGSDTQIQYNNAGAFGGITGATTNGTIVTLTSPVFVTPALGTPASGVLTNATGLPISTGVSGLGTGVATFLATPSSANLASAVTDETGSGSLVFAASPTLTGTVDAAAATFSNTVALTSTTAANNKITQGAAINIGTTSTDGIVLQNTTAAAAGAQQYSPRLRLTGQGWKTNATAASQTVDWVFENRPVQGTTAPTTTLSIQSQINGGGYSELGYFDSTNGFILSNNVSLQVKKAAGTLVPVVKMETFDQLNIGYAGNAQTTAIGGDPMSFLLRNVTGMRLGNADVANNRIAVSIGSANTVTTDTLNVSDRNASVNNTTVVFRASPSQATSSKIFRIMATDGTTEKYGVAADGYVITYNGAATAGIGTTPVYASVASTGQTASITTTNLQVGGAVAPSGLYKVTYYVVATTAGTSGTLDVTIAWNDGTAARSDANTFAITFGSTAYATKSVIIRADGTNNITYATTVNSPVGSPVYAIYLVLERLA